MLYTLLGLNRRIDSGSCGSYRPSAESEFQMVVGNIPAAAAGSAPVDFLGSELGVSELPLAAGLRLRFGSLCRVEGERDRRSKREVRFGSGSVWSKRERFELLRSSSAIVRSCCYDKILRR